MKKLRTILLCGMLAFLITGCQSDTSNKTNTNSDTNTQTDTNSSATSNG